MIIDAHCHAWRQWPYQPAVPDPQSRARVERLLWEMDQTGVDQAVLIAASIDSNADNGEYTAQCVTAHSDRILAFPDIDCRWHSTHHTPGADQRLKQVVQELSPRGFTHYLHEDRDPAWLLSADGLDLFMVAQEARLIVSLACGPRQLPTVCELAARFPATPFLIHHLGRVTTDPMDSEGLNALLGASATENVFIKLSGFGYASSRGWDYPCSGTHVLVKALYERFGPDRLCWGSDYPVSQRYMTYKQSLEIVRTHCHFIPPSDMSKILGDTFHALLQRTSTQPCTGL